MEDLNFLQSVTRIRALENRLLNRNSMEKLIDFDSTLQILEEYKNTQLASPINTNGDYEEMLLAELQALYNLMFSISPEKELVDLMALKYDYHNLKVLTKAKMSKINRDSLLIPLGTIPIDTLVNKFDNNDYRDFNSVMRNSVEKAINAQEHADVTVNVDVIFDNAYFDEMLALADKINKKTIIRFVQLCIDLYNLKSFIRIRMQKKDRTIFQGIFKFGGALGEDFFLQSFYDEEEVFIQKLINTDYNKLFTEPKNGMKNFKGLGNLDKAMDNYIMKYVRDFRLISFGPEPLLSYIVAKETEVKNLRTIIVGKANSIAKENLKERLRETYE